MQTTIAMPSLGESVIEGTIDHWIKQPGESFDAFDPLVEVITDKVNAEIPAPMAGTLVEILARPGDVVAVGAPLAVVESITQAEAAATETAAGAPAEAGPAIAEPLVRAQPAASPPPMRYSPSVEQLATERGIDLSRVAGTGIGGRVTRRDVLSHSESSTAAPSTPSSPMPMGVLTQPEQPNLAQRGTPAGSERIPLSTIRRMVADNTTRSKATVPHAWQAHEVDMSRIVAYRNKVKDEFRQREGTSLTFVPFVIKAVCEALHETPKVNAQYDGDSLIVFRDINVGVAIGFEDTLVVPVIKKADSLSLAGLARAIADLADRARKGRLKIDEMQGGTFTVNNVGTFGAVLSYSIINAPQAAILTMEAVVDRVVAVDGMIAIRPTMFLCFSWDHRVIDGLQAARFVQAVRRSLEAFDSETAQLY